METLNLMDISDIYQLSEADIIHLIITSIPGADYKNRISGWKIPKEVRSREYRSEIKDSLKELFKEQEFRCEKCRSQFNLCVHHIDRDHSNNEKSNLQLLCNRCHHRKTEQTKENDNELLECITIASQQWAKARVVVEDMPEIVRDYLRVRLEELTEGYDVSPEQFGLDLFEAAIERDNQRV